MSDARLSPVGRTETPVMPAPHGPAAGGEGER